VNIKSVNRLILSLIMLGLLSGCLGLGSVDLSMGLGADDEEDDARLHYYVIDVDRGAVAAQFAQDRVLRIMPVKVSPQFSGSHIMFKIADNEYATQDNHQFFSKPSELFTYQLQRWLQKTGQFSQVITDPNLPADLVLETSVTALYGEQREAFSPQSALEMQFFLLSESSEGSRALFQTGLRIDIDIEKTTPANVVKGWNLGLEELLATVEDDFSGYFSKRNP